MGIRFTVVISIFVLAYAYLGFHLYQLQILNNEEYLARAESQYAAAGSLKAPRGGIFFTDKNGSPLPAVLNKDFPVIYAVPKVVEDAKEASSLIAPVLGLSATELEEKLSKKNDLYKVLAKKVPTEATSQIEDLKIIESLLWKALKKKFWNF